jgi:hypothetical protein
VALGVTHARIDRGAPTVPLMMTWLYAGATMIGAGVAGFALVMFTVTCT